MSVPRSSLISVPYLETQRELHAAPRGYGGKGDKWADAVVAVATERECFSILDYGCGQGTLMRELRGRDLANRRLAEYDPAIPGKDGLPSFADLVVCTDVLEHIEPDRLSSVLAHLKSLARRAVFVVIATRPASKTLSDGRNAHLIIEDAAWWHATVEAAGFTVHEAPSSPSKKPSREWVAVLTC
jgi:hypothetical protein